MQYTLKFFIDLLFKTETLVMWIPPGADQLMQHVAAVGATARVHAGGVAVQQVMRDGALAREGEPEQRGGPAAGGWCERAHVLAFGHETLDAWNCAVIYIVLGTEMLINHGGHLD